MESELFPVEKLKSQIQEGVGKDLDKGHYRVFFFINLSQNLTK